MNNINKAFRKAITLATKKMAKGEQLRTINFMEYNSNKDFTFLVEVCDKDGQNYRDFYITIMID